jgi:hypothetical protein
MIKVISIKNDKTREFPEAATWLIENNGVLTLFRRDSKRGSVPIAAIACGQWDIVENPEETK